MTKKEQEKEVLLRFKVGRKGTMSLLGLRDECFVCGRRRRVTPLELGSIMIALCRDCLKEHRVKA